MKFLKLHGAGNDFILIEETEIAAWPKDQLGRLAQILCRPHFSLGGDGLMLVGPPTRGGHFSMTFYNCDGSIGELCGNGARCLVCYGLSRGLCSPNGQVVIETDSGLVTGRACHPMETDPLKQCFTVCMPEVSLMQACTLEVTASAASAWTGTYPCTYAELGSPGVPHLILPLPPRAASLYEKSGSGILYAKQPLPPKAESLYEKLDDFALRFHQITRMLRPLASSLRHHPTLEKGANVNFYYVTDAHSLDLYTYERGVEDFTFACGSGASCTAGALLAAGVLTPKESSCAVSIQTYGGCLQVSCDLFCPLSDRKTPIPIHNIHLSGPAVIVAEGDVQIPCVSLFFLPETPVCP